MKKTRKGLLPQAVCSRRSADAAPAKKTTAPDKHNSHHDCEENEAAFWQEDDSFVWMGAAEDRDSADMMEALWEVLDQTHVDPDQRIIVWPGNARLTLAGTLQRLAECYPGYPRERIESHLIAWLEQEYDPGEQSQEQRYEWDTKIEQWVAEYEQREPISIPTFF